MVIFDLPDPCSVKNMTFRPPRVPFSALFRLWSTNMAPRLPRMCPQTCVYPRGMLRNSFGTISSGCAAPRSEKHVFWGHFGSGCTQDPSFTCHIVPPDPGHMRSRGRWCTSESTFARPVSLQNHSHCLQQPHKPHKSGAGVL